MRNKVKLLLSVFVVAFIFRIFQQSTNVKSSPPLRAEPLTPPLRDSRDSGLGSVSLLLPTTHLQGTKQHLLVPQVSGCPTSTPWRHRGPSRDGGSRNLSLPLYEGFYVPSLVWGYFLASHTAQKETQRAENVVFSPHAALDEK